MGLEPVHVGLEAVDLEAGLLQHKRDQVLCRALVAGYRWDSDQILREPNAGVRVERLERPGFWSLSDHAVSVVGCEVAVPTSGVSAAGRNRSGL